MRTRRKFGSWAGVAVASATGLAVWVAARGVRRIRDGSGGQPAA